MDPEKTLGRELHAVSTLLDRRMNAITSANGADRITPMHGMILGFLTRSRMLGREVYQKDVESEFDIVRSTVTANLKLMEHKGYIRREGVAHDARLKRIVLTPCGEESFQLIHSSIQETEALIRSALTGAEYDELVRLLARVKSVLW